MIAVAGIENPRHPLPRDDASLRRNDNESVAIAASKLIGYDSNLANITSLNNQHIPGLKDGLPVLIAPLIRHKVRDIKLDLIALDNASLEEIIASTEIESGNYNKIRFAVISATVTTESGIYEAEIPSKVIKISVPFVVYEDGHTEITVEINPKASLNISGSKNNPKYILRPVLKVTDVEEEGEEGDD